MKLLIVSHDADLTGAPRVAFEIALGLGSKHTVKLLSKREGPLIRNEKFAELSDRYGVTNTSHVDTVIPFGELVREAVRTISAERPDLVYVSSVAAAEWCVAAHNLGVPTALHLHEMAAQLRSFLYLGAFPLDLLDYVDLLVSASPDATADLVALTRRAPMRCFNFGIGIDVEFLRRMSERPGKLPLNGLGQPLTRTRPVVVMVGTAQRRKGFDIFFEVAKQAPEFDFLWIGPLSDDAVAKAVVRRHKSERPPNFFLAGALDNPYSLMKMADAFALTSVEDPNPLVVAEALALGRRVVSFQDSGGSAYWTRRYGYCLSGRVDAERLASFLRTLFASSELPPWIDAASRAASAELNIGTRIEELDEQLRGLANIRVFQ